jgi:hypothetical protein
MVRSKSKALVASCRHASGSTLSVMVGRTGGSYLYHNRRKSVSTFDPLTLHIFKHKEDFICFSSFSRMYLRPLGHRTETGYLRHTEATIKNYFLSFMRKRTPMARILVLRHLYKYLLTVPDFLRSKQLFRETLIKKTKEFKKDARARNIIPLFNEVLKMCQE